MKKLSLFLALMLLFSSIGLTAFAQEVPAFVLRCRPDEAAVEAAERALDTLY